MTACRREDAVLLEDVPGSFFLVRGSRLPVLRAGRLNIRRAIRGVAFKKTFTYAGAEQQPKAFRDPLIVCLNVELDLKA